MTELANRFSPTVKLLFYWVLLFAFVVPMWWEGAYVTMVSISLFFGIPLIVVTWKVVREREGWGKSMEGVDAAFGAMAGFSFIIICGAAIIGGLAFYVVYIPASWALEDWVPRNYLPLAVILGSGFVVFLGASLWELTALLYRRMRRLKH